MDILSDVLGVIRISGAVLFHGEFSAPWCVATPPAHEMARRLMPGAKRLILFHIVAEGECWAERDDAPAVHLAAGDVIVLPYGHAHALADTPGQRPTPIAALLPPPPWSKLPVVKHGGSGTPTRILCGFLHADDAPLHPLLTSLPAMLRVRARTGEPAHRLETIIGYTLEEAKAARPGVACLLTRLVDILFVEILRRHMEELTEEDIRPLAGLKDPLVRRTLELLHAEPQRRWTLADLARLAGTSRSVLAERFKALMGCAPMQYVTQWRLQIAAHRLCQPQESMAKVAAQIGYDSEAAFNRAFKRYVGEPPATWRRKRLSGVEAIGSTTGELRR
jgi:AraC family transcriptional regulator, alkane utilization regulator